MGITPLDFLLPLAMYIFLRKPVLWKKVLAWILLVFYVIVMILGAVAAIRGIVLDASKHSLVKQPRLLFAVIGPHCCEWVWCMFCINMWLGVPFVARLLNAKALQMLVATFGTMHGGLS